MRNIKSELKITGINLVLLSSGIAVVFIMLSLFGGDLLQLSRIGFEVIFPFFAAMAVGEWGKTRADSNYDIICAQGKSLFSWVLLRFLTVFVMVTFFAVLCIVGVYFVREELPVWEMILLYLPTALFLAALGALFNICFKQEHISTLLCGVIWLIAMLTSSLLRFPCVAYVYLFIRYAGIQDGTWLINKAVLTSGSLLIWGIIYIICRRGGWHGS